MKSFSKATKAGMIFMLIAGLIMALLVVISKPVPNLIACVFASTYVPLMAKVFRIALKRD